ncbi:FadR/GntR family transcriptional regulator [Streptomyces sp. NPDC006134]|uniref:FadR/GntR family transcriptional regulator n=1 Tax=Streptomyces sp. NPDC006134 TaxID=3154467 RepID=UPI0033D7A268
MTVPQPARQSAVDRVVQALEERILTTLEPGDSLPSEGDLAVDLSVSRLTVREATRTLAARGLIEVRQGRRPQVSAPNADPVSDFFRYTVRRDPRNLLELLDVRIALEVHIAGLAARRATASALQRLDLALEEMWRAEDEPEAYHRADVRFHEALASASGNSMLTVLIEALADPLHDSRRHSYAGHARRGLTVAQVIEVHAEILRRVKDRDPKGASAAMRAHLEQTERDLRAALREEMSGPASR